MKKSDPIQTRNNLLIALLAQFVVYSAIWLWNEYVATYVSLIIPGVILVVLVLATIADFIEPSRIPSWYYALMLVSILAPLLIGAFFFYIYSGQLDWL